MNRERKIRFRGVATVCLVGDVSSGWHARFGGEAILETYTSGDGVAFAAFSASWAILFST